MDATPAGTLGTHGAVKGLMYELESDGQGSLRGARPDGAAECCDCAFSEPAAAAQCRCTHPSSESKEGPLFPGALACNAFVPRRRRSPGLFTGHGGMSWLRGN